MGSNIWWLSFAGEEGHRGCAIVHALDFGQAVHTAHVLGINPGGEVKGVEMPEEEDAKAEVDHLGMNRLIPTKELREKGYLTTKEQREPN
jgi:hypothetical protein